ncbi:MAG: MFS transporter [Promethearchaeota archaeon]|nr:MAG: MFS transporter [Candidatus Lokiarchaeota archaeon]
MSAQDLQIYKYRWIVLFLFFFTNVVSNILWTTYPPITSLAMKFYGVDEFYIILISLIFLIVYIPITFLASWLIDKYDFKVGSGIGALLMGVFGFLRYMADKNYSLALIFSIGIAIAQPFLLNTITKLSANWFPDKERTTATGISLIATSIGIALGMIITPILVIGINFRSMLLIYGILALASSLLFLIFAKNKPPTPPSTNLTTERIFMFEGLKMLFSNRNFMILTIIFFLSMGVFNMIMTYIELIVLPRNYDSIFAGILGMLIIVGGIIGTIIMALLSDFLNIRKKFMIISLFIATISLLVFSFTSDEFLLLISGFFFGFGLMGAAPLALEYAVDATKPVPEASSNGILMMVGSLGGIVLIISLENVKILGDYFPALIIQTVLLAFCFFLAFFIKEFKVRKE